MTIAALTVPPAGVVTVLVIDHLVQAIDQAGRIVAGVGPDQWGGPTPCSDWDVRALTNHLVVGVQLFDAAARGEPSSLAAYAGDALGEDPAGAYQAAADRFREALAAPDIEERTWTAAWGDSPGAQAAALALIELHQHGWDIARATGQRVVFDPAAAAAALDAARTMIGQYGRGDGVFAAEAECSAGAPPEDRLAAFLGRRP